MLALLFILVIISSVEVKEGLPPRRLFAWPRMSIGMEYNLRHSGENQAVGSIDCWTFNVLIKAAIELSVEQESTWINKIIEI